MLADGAGAGVAPMTSFAGVVDVDAGGPVTEIAFVAAGSAVAFGAIGSAIRAHRRYWEQVALRSAELVSARDAAVSAGVASERLRIARELHDVIGHQVAAVNMRLGAAEVNLPPQATRSREELHAARGAIQTVLSETQHLLAVLRRPGETPDPAPDADFSAVAATVQACRDAGLDVEAVLPADPPALSTEASRAAYRIIQEAMTNAAKHGTGPVSLVVGTDEDVLSIEVVNAVAVPDGSPRTLQGLGLVGMRERAASVGGTVETRRDQTRFWLTATLPLAGQEPA